MSDPPSKPILSDEHIMALGQLIFAVSKINTLLTDLMSAFLGADLIGTLAAIHHQQIASKVDTLIALVKLRLRGIDRAEQITDLISRAGAVAEQRNRLVHAHWSIDEAGIVYAVRFQARREFKRSRKPISAEAIRQHAREADEIARQMTQLRERLLKANSVTRCPHTVRRGSGEGE